MGSISSGVLLSIFPAGEPTQSPMQAYCARCSIAELHPQSWAFLRQVLNVVQAGPKLYVGQAA